MSFTVKAKTGLITLTFTGVRNVIGLVDRVCRQYGPCGISIQAEKQNV